MYRVYGEVTQDNAQFFQCRCAEGGDELALLLPEAASAELHQPPQWAALLRGNALGLLQGRAHYSPGAGPRALPSTDLADYQALFEGVTDEKAIGEASASYLYSPKAPGLTKGSVPDAKFIATLRNPADRAYSNFLHCVRSGRESIVDFAEALRAEEGRIRDNWGPLWHYKRKGFYYAQVRRYLDTFGRDQFRVWLYEDLRAEQIGRAHV